MFKIVRLYKLVRLFCIFQRDSVNFLKAPERLNILSNIKERIFEKSGTCAAKDIKEQAYI